MEIVSPITGSGHVELEREIGASFIVDLYKKQMNLDVGRFFHNVSDVSIYKCLDTGYRFYYPFTLVGDDTFYQELEKFPWYYDAWKWEHGVVSDFIKSGTRVLEIGCARGKFLQKMKEKGAIVEGLEMNSKALEDCKNMGLAVHPDSIEKFSEKGNSYDVVCSFQVLEHIASVKSFLDASLKVLKPGGLMIVGVPNSDSFMFKSKDVDLNMPPHHMGLWNMNSLIKLQNHFGMTIDSIHLEPVREGHLPSLENVVSEDFHIPILGKIYKRLFSRGVKSLAPHVNGHTVVAVFKKHEKAS